ncbi:acyltransferase [Ureibacillus sp. MALMAid1270]|uniref:acyltransferase n=1 Tax=Ureibacillus sp. MALMAid1270 TaxID=3411629 RepID=UPI003BA6101F
MIFNGVQKRLDEITIARAIAITGVLLVHGFSTGATTVEPSSIMFPIYNFLNTAGKWGTPTFIFLSSFILFYTYYNRKLDTKLVTNFYKKRLKFILVPYIFFSLFYFSIKWIFLDSFSYGDIWERLSFYLLWGKAHTHLYFVIISVQFYILFPLFLWAMKKSALLRKYSILIGLVIQWAYIFINRHYLQIDFKGSIVFNYATFYFMGAYIGIYYEQIKTKMREILSYRDKVVGIVFACYGIFLVVYVGYNYLTRMNAWIHVKKVLPEFIVINFYEFSWGFYAIFAALMILILSNYIANSKHERFKQFLMNIGIMSFGIYLIHPLFLMVFREVLFSGNSLLFHVFQFLTFILVYVISYYLVYFTYRYIPFSWIVFGKSEVKYKFK